MVVDTGRTYPHPAGTGMHDHGDLLQMMDMIAETGKRFIIHPHDQALMDYIEGEYLAPRREHAAGLRVGLRRARRRHLGHRDRRGAATRRGLRLPGPPRAHADRRSIDAVRRAKARGVDVTCEVNHWGPFLSTWEDVEPLGPYALSYWVPDDGRAAIWEGLRDGTIDIFSSDHAPHTREEKEIGWTKMWSAHTGTPGIQYFYPLLLDAVNRGQAHPRAGRRADGGAAGEGSSASAGQRARSRVGLDADLVIADLTSPWTITQRRRAVHAAAGHRTTAARCRASIEHDFVRGEVVYADGKVVGEPGQGGHRPSHAADRIRDEQERVR